MTTISYPLTAIFTVFVSGSVKPVNLGPLTTTFIPPAACSVAVSECSTCALAWFAQNCSPETHDDPSCWPTRSKGVITPTGPLNTWGFFSPGVICPSGFVSACSSVAGVTSGFDFGYELAEGETAIGCCPSGLPCNGPRTCNTAATSTSFPIVSCEAGTSDGFEYLTLPLSNSGVVTSSYELNGPMIQLVFKASDIKDKSIPAQTTQLPSQTQDSSISSIPINTASILPASAAKSHSGLSKPAEIAIGIAGALGVLIVVVCVFLFIRRHRRYRGVRTHSKLPKYEFIEPVSNSANFKAELPGDTTSYVAELPASPITARN